MIHICRHCGIQHTVNRHRRYHRNRSRPATIIVINNILLINIIIIIIFTMFIIIFVIPYFGTTINTKLSCLRKVECFLLNTRRLWIYDTAIYKPIWCNTIELLNRNDNMVYTIILLLWEGNTLISNQLQNFYWNIVIILMQFNVHC